MFDWKEKGFTIEIPDTKGQGSKTRAVTVSELAFTSAAAGVLASVFEEMLSLTGQNRPGIDIKWQKLEGKADPDALTQAIDASIAASTDAIMLEAGDPRQFLDKAKANVARYQGVMGQIANIQLAVAAEMPVEHSRKAAASWRADLIDKHTLEIDSALELLDACLRSIE